jgi:hypothetical protein
MSRFPQRFVLSSAACALVLAVGLATWVLAAGSSEAQPGSMHNCPPAGKWSIAVWEGTSGTAAADALAACGEGSVAAAYSLDPQSGAWSRWFAGKPDVSNLAPLNDMQGVLALGGSVGPVATPTPAATPIVTATATPTATHTPSLPPTVTPTMPAGCVACLEDLEACQESADALACWNDCLFETQRCTGDCYFEVWDCALDAPSLISAWDCFSIWNCPSFCLGIWDCDEMCSH